MRWTAGRSRHRPPRRPLLFSVATHAVVVTAILFSEALAPEPLVFETFQIQMVASAELENPAPAQREDEVVVETPDPTPPQPEPEPEPEELPPPPEEETTPPPEEEEEEEEPPPVEEESPPVREEAPPTPPTPPVEEEPEETTGEAAGGVNVRLEGLRRDYPAYYEGIITGIQRCFRPPAGTRGDLEAEVYFEIRRDGTVPERRLVVRSGDVRFDLAALGAVECAGNRGFGPLPEDLPWDRLPVQFFFRPRGIGGGPIAAPPVAPPTFDAP